MGRGGEGNYRGGKGGDPISQQFEKLPCYKLDNANPENERNKGEERDKKQAHKPDVNRVPVEIAQKERGIDKSHEHEATNQPRHRHVPPLTFHGNFIGFFRVTTGRSTRSNDDLILRMKEEKCIVEM